MQAVKNRYCGTCGYQTEWDDTFCGECGDDNLVANDPPINFKPINELLQSPITRLFKHSHSPENSEFYKRNKPTIGGK